MKTPSSLRTLAFAAAALAAGTSSAWAKNPQIENVQRTTETQIRHLVEPLLDKYCRDECKLLSVGVNVDISVPDEIAPGFDDVQAPTATPLAPTSATLKLLINDNVGPVSRGKLVELLQQYLDTLDFPAKIDLQVSHFPQPIGSEGKIAELREKAAKQFTNQINELFQQFCPNQCLMADFNLKTEVVNGEESQYGSPGEFIQDGDSAIRIKDISATLLMDETLTPEERENVLEMARLKTSFFKNVDLTAKALKFPQPAPLVRGLNGNLVVGGIAGAMGATGERQVSSEKTTRNEANSATTNNDTKNLSTDTRNNSTSSTTNAAAETKNQLNTTTQNTTSDTGVKQERFERIEKIERVENGDAVQAELQKFKVYGLVFACSILSLLIFIAMASWKPARRDGGSGTIQRVIQSLAHDPVTAEPRTMAAFSESRPPGNEERAQLVGKRYEIERLTEELMGIFAQHAKVAKHVFSRILTEEGVETTAQYIHIFGENIVLDMLRDPTLQSDMTELMEYYAKNPMQIEDDEKLDLLRKLHNRTVASKLLVLGNRSSNLFDFLTEMDSMQIQELIRNESLTLKAIVLTQCDPQKRASVYSQLDEDVRMKLLAELSRIDHLPRDYIYNVSSALRRKRQENPRLNTESLPGSEVLVGLLERTGIQIQKAVVRNLEGSNPESARTVKSKLVSIDTLRYLRDSQLLEVVLSLKHEELLQFLKGTSNEIRKTIYSKSPKELVLELEEELEQVPTVSRETYQNVERKVLNRMKLMSNEGLINLIETNERMFANGNGEKSGFVQAGPGGAGQRKQGGTDGKTNPGIRKVAGW